VQQADDPGGERAGEGGSAGGAVAAPDGGGDHRRARRAQVDAVGPVTGEGAVVQAVRGGHAHQVIAGAGRGQVAHHVHVHVVVRGGAAVQYARRAQRIV